MPSAGDPAAAALAGWQALGPAARFRLAVPQIGVALALAVAWPRDELEAAQSAWRENLEAL